MKYTINTAVLGNTFIIPSIVADQFLKIATAAQLKVLLWFMRNISEAIDVEKIASALSLPASEVEDALIFWSQSGVLNSEQPKEKEPKRVAVTATLPTRADVIRRGLEDEKLMFLLQEAQLVFGRNLKQNESQILVSLYDDHGMDACVILLLLSHCAKQGKCNVSNIKKTADEWLGAGVETVQEAEAYIKKNADRSIAWNKVCAIFGIDRRKPSEKEIELSNLWVNELKLSDEMLKAAYNICVDNNGKFSMAYIAKVLEKSNKNTADTKSKTTSKSKTKPSGKTTEGGAVGFDINKYEEMLKRKIKKGGGNNDA